MAKAKCLETPSWENLLDDPVVSAECSNGGYANDTWLVNTQDAFYVLKVTRITEQPNKPFWDGLSHLFGLNVHHHIEYQRQLAGFIRKHSPLDVPRIVEADASGERLSRPFVLMEGLPGKAADFDEAPHPANLAYQLGDHLGSIHQAEFSYWGVFPADPGYPALEWPQRLAKTIEFLAEKWYPDKPEVHDHLPDYIQQTLALPQPRHLALTLPDFKPGQFLMNDGRLTAMVDIESHVVGPRELDFIALEHSLPGRLADDFRRGYERHLPIPDLQAVRPVYRFLYFLTDVLAIRDFNQWMTGPALFGE